MRTIFILCILFCALDFSAQNLFFSVGVDNVYQLNAPYSQNGHIGSYTNIYNEQGTYSQLYIEPSIGFTIKTCTKNLFFGTEIGYFGYNNHRSRTLINNSYTERIESTAQITHYYFGINLEQYYRLGKNYYSLGVRLPIRFFPQRLDLSHSIKNSNTLPSNSTEIYQSNLWPNTLRVSLLINPSFSKKLYKNLFFQFYINAGLQIEHRFGNARNISWSKTNSIEDTHTDYTTSYKNYYETQFILHPSFKFCYWMTYGKEQKNTK